MNFTFEQLPQAVSGLYQELAEIKELLASKGNDFLLKEDQLLNIEQASQMLFLSIPTLYGLVQKREMPFCKRGNRLYFSRQEILDWIKATRHKTSKEVSDQADSYILNKKVKN